MVGCRTSLQVCHGSWADSWESGTCSTEEEEGGEQVGEYCLPLLEEANLHRAGLVIGICAFLILHPFSPYSSSLTLSGCWKPPP